MILDGFFSFAVSNYCRLPSWIPLLFVHYCMQRIRLQKLHNCFKNYTTMFHHWMLYIMLRFSFLRYNKILFYAECHYMQEFHLFSHCVLIFSEIWVHLELFSQALVKIDCCVFPIAKLFQKCFRSELYFHFMILSVAPCF